MLNYYRHFVPHLARLLSSLHLAVAAAKKPKDFEWTPACEAASGTAKLALAKARLLHHPSSFVETAITGDASNVAIEAKLTQWGRDQQWRSLAFFFKSLKPAEKKYSAFDHDFLATYATIRHFSHFLCFPLLL